MNPSLSTVESVPIGIAVNMSSLQRHAGGGVNASRINSIDLDGAKARSSPSFNDSEPPSYFEVVGAAGYTCASVIRETQNSPPSSTATAVVAATARYSAVNMRQQPQRSSAQPPNSKEFTSIGTTS